MIDLGDLYRISVHVRDAGGVAVDPDEAALVVTLPDGSTETVDVEHVDGKPGWVYGDFQTSMSGRHSYVLSTQGPVSVYRDVFDVYEVDTGLIVSLVETKKQLNIVGNGDDDEIRGYIQAATTVVHHYVGPSSVQEYSETHMRGPVILNFNPVVELLSIEAIRSRPYDPEDIEADVNGQLWDHMGRELYGSYRVRYRAGYEVVPANRTRAAMLIVAHMWETQRTNDIRRPPPSSQDGFLPQDAYGRSFSIPRRAVELLEADMIGGVS